MDETLLGQVPLFAALPHEEIQRLALTLRQLEIAPGAILLHEGDHGDCFYFIHEGELEVVKALGTADERVLTVEGPGGFIGEMSLLNRNGLRTASVRARTAARVSEMQHADVDALLHRQPMIAYDIARVLSTRLNQVNDATIRDLREKNRELEATNRQLVAAYQELQAAQAQIVEKEALERELQVARKIQMSMLPHALPEVAGFNFGARMIPARAVGGDFFDFVPLGGDSLGIVVGDVSGKGVPAALFMALTRSLVRAEASRTVAPGETLVNVNRYLLDMNDAGMFVTVLYGVLHQTTREFHYARAGHEQPLVVDRQGIVSMPRLGLGHPLGIVPDSELDEQRIAVPPGGLLLLYTDGVTEAMDPSGALFRLTGLQAAMSAQPAGAAQAACDRLVAMLEAYRDSAQQADDITLVAVRAAGV